MTVPNHRTMRACAAAHDRQLAGAYAQGVADGRRERRRLVVAGALAAVVLLGRRHLHPLAALAWAAAVVLALWPLVLVGVAIEAVHRQHGRWRSWPRTGALVATWAAVVLSAYAAVRMGTAWPLVGAPVALVAWAVEHGARVHGWRLPVHHGPEAPQGITAPAALPRPVVEPYRVTFTDKAHHVETRVYADGRRVILNTRTGREVADPFGTW